MNFIDDFTFKFKWYLKNRFKINRSGRVKEASKEFNEYINSLPRGSFVIDVGANVGKFTNIFLKKEFKVHAFEADPIAVNELKKNCGNDNKNLKLFEVAVGIKKESKKLYRYRKFDAANPETTIGSSVLSIRSGKDKPFVEVTREADLAPDDDGITFRDYEFLAGGQAGNLDAFTQFQIKIVMNTTNTSKIPIFKDLRTVALVT